MNESSQGRMEDGGGSRSEILFWSWREARKGGREGRVGETGNTGEGVRNSRGVQGG